MQTIAMPTASNLASWIEEYFRKHQVRTSEVLSGPKRETWFSAETYVALCGAATPHPENPELPSFSCWGEQEFASVFHLLEADQPSVGARKRRPDIVCYNLLEGVEAVETVIEIKVIRNDESATACLAELKGQLSNASLLFPKANIVGVIFFAVAPYLTPGRSCAAAEKLKSGIETVFPRHEQFTVVPDSKLQPIFDAVSTRFHYPRMSASLSVTVVQLSVQT